MLNKLDLKTKDLNFLLTFQYKLATGSSLLLHLCLNHSASGLARKVQDLMHIVKHKCSVESEYPQRECAGAVALLLEAGEWFSAAEWGQAWLASNRNHPCAPDIALCVATAHYKDTVHRIEQSIEHAQDCEAGLAASLKLLQSYHIAEDIQAELQDTLEVKALEDGQYYLKLLPEMNITLNIDILM